MARRRRRSSFSGDEALRDAQALIQKNPVTTAVAALAAGAIATSIFKVYASKPATAPAAAAKPAAKKKTAKRKKTATKKKSKKTVTKKKSAAKKKAKAK